MERKKKLLDQFAKAHKFDGLPPLANKILGVFYLSDEKYLSFETLTEFLDSSKGAVSKMLKILIAVRRVNFIQDPTSKRKRLFYLDSKGAEEYVNLVVEGLMEQRSLMLQLSAYRTSESDKEIDDLIERTLAFNQQIVTALQKNNKKYYKK
ncbi:hypothetical protein KMW28_24610 [Flammeovirga yaeyamensis]|uniref:Transcriptional regulator n=1 Tax=Flammeovirga yaeyamensis TaxID=367791 RepID=A0AAX1NCE2_9BACT|nr:hypothetical protein [Flammeovirga yaeyamensis]MBB3699530.1 DNA-binding transcriptional regulator GbsR (MarR family) [Flammeovirga yaeyamensis]NMF35214.1 hypothetical protein [Flammeovirga yaeyamensis]QWG04076.1 hypothetical protein KMW28_24610 [Flammeovirga yaeyamensis]